MTVHFCSNSFQETVSLVFFGAVHPCYFESCKFLTRILSLSLNPIIITHSLTAALDQLRVVASSTSNDPGPRSRQRQQIGQRLLPLAAANFSVDDPAGASSQQREECRCGLLLTVEVPAKQVCSPVGDRCVQIMNDVCNYT